MTQNAKGPPALEASGSFGRRGRQPHSTRSVGPTQERVYWYHVAAFGGVYGILGLLMAVCMEGLAR